MRDTQPPLDFFLTSSATGLQSYELSRMNHAANLRKELRQIMEEWIQAEVNARFARLVMESRTVLPCPASAATEPARSFEQLAISFLPAHDPDARDAADEASVLDQRAAALAAAGSATASAWHCRVKLAVLLTRSSKTAANFHSWPHLFPHVSLRRTALLRG